MEPAEDTVVFKMKCHLDTIEQRHNFMGNRTEYWLNIKELPMYLCVGELPPTLLPGDEIELIIRKPNAQPQQPPVE